MARHGQIFFFLKCAGGSRLAFTSYLEFRTIGNLYAIHAFLWELIWGIL